ncbi:MAG: hypothetical protein AAGI46_11575 [Planctomycetota bacterium]
MAGIANSIARAHRGEHPAVVARLVSGWAVMSDRQYPRGWCVLMADPVVPTLNDLDEPSRLAFLSDVAALGDAVLAATGCRRINYAIYGNQEPELHAHIIPRYADEPSDLITKPIWLHPAEKLDGRPFDAERDADLVAAIRDHLESKGRTLAK